MNFLLLGKIKNHLSALEHRPDSEKRKGLEEVLIASDLDKTFPKWAAYIRSIMDDTGSKPTKEGDKKEAEQNVSPYRVRIIKNS